MTDATNSTQTKDQSDFAKAGSAIDDSEMISIDQLDSMILSEDPKFAEELREVSSLPVDGSIDLDVVDLVQTFSSERENPWRDAIGIRKVIVTIFPFLPWAWELFHTTSDKIYFFRTRFKIYLVQAGPLLLQGLKHGSLATGDFLGQKIATYKQLNRPLKLLALGLLAASLFTGAFVYRSFTHGVIPGDKEFLIASLEEWAGQTYKYDPETEMDSFYDSPRTIQNIMALPKMVVNLKPSNGSGPNPMAMMEFFLEGMSPEAIVEVKDREPEIRDLFQRTMEEMTFEELDISEGKQLLTERLRQALNMVLTRGKVRKVFIKEAVIKP